MALRSAKDRAAAAAVLAGVLAITLAGCGDDDDDSAATTTSTAGGEAPPFGEAEADSVLPYRLVEFAFEGPGEAKGPKLFFTADNSGSEDHELEVLDSRGEALGEIEAFPPGGEAEPLAVVAEPGTYTLQCFLETKDGRRHRDLGMVAELVVR
ncbi:MAG TPA: hypothetical protein VI854_06750 [Acidimicrobiia bacterium]|nr:hypothetical protein [Acidimicrobiia bacterium]